MRKTIIGACLSLGLLICAIVVFMLMYTGKSKLPCVVYYLNRNQTELVSETVNISYADPTHIPQNIISKLKNSGFGKKSPIPKGCTVNTVSFDSADSITVDLSGEFVDTDTELNVLRAYAIIKSICSTSASLGISRVRVTVDGKYIKAPNGMAIGYLSDSSINIMNSEETITYECDLYFLDKESNNLKPERRKIDAANGTIEYNTINAMIEGPTTKGLQNVFPKGTTLQSAQTLEGVCYVSFAELPPSASETLINSALTHTLSAFDGIDSVKILIKGKYEK